MACSCTLRVRVTGLSQVTGDTPQESPQSDFLSDSVAQSDISQTSVLRLSPHTLYVQTVTDSDTRLYSLDTVGLPWVYCNV